MMKVRFGISIDEEAVKALDKSIKKKGRFANRSQAIEYCIKQVLAMEGHKRGSMEFLLDFLDLIEEHPEIKERFKGFLKEELK
jgi:metal-responsive CopG/Arc/MetJ family transcriptional regulator